jgi:hypothetical protein
VYPDGAFDSCGAERWHVRVMYVTWTMTAHSPPLVCIGRLALSVLLSL